MGFFGDLTSLFWNWLRAHTAPRCQQERPRSGRLFTMNAISTSPFFVGGGFRMVGGAFGIHEHQSYWNRCNIWLRFCIAILFFMLFIQLFITNVLVYHNVYISFWLSLIQRDATCPKLMAACCAEAVKIITVRYSTSCSRFCSDFGNSKDKDKNVLRHFVWSFLSNTYTEHS